MRATISLSAISKCSWTEEGVTFQVRACPFFRNQLYAEDFGVTAEIIPMLIGFFTYKVSTIIEV